MSSHISLSGRSTDKQERHYIGCFDCLRPHSNYMVKDSVWSVAWSTYARDRRSNPDIFLDLCFSCLESRLGRKLSIDDFTDVPINGGFFWAIFWA